MVTRGEQEFLSLLQANTCPLPIMEVSARNAARCTCLPPRAGLRNRLLQSGGAYEVASQSKRCALLHQDCKEVQLITKSSF